MCPLILSRASPRTTSWQLGIPSVPASQASGAAMTNCDSMCLLPLSDLLSSCFIDLWSTGRTDSVFPKACWLDRGVQKRSPAAEVNAISPPLSNKVTQIHPRVISTTIKPLFRPNNIQRKEHLTSSHKSQCLTPAAVAPRPRTVDARIAASAPTAAARAARCVGLLRDGPAPRPLPLRRANRRAEIKVSCGLLRADYGI
ncbi:hypothetical protein GQ53DRAFT_187210 [Thozetella sp. PMI_491]|nr:hypothetical protein GQ53DRAFT_187210 [Thozetella sp. PMI_491]